MTEIIIFILNSLLLGVGLAMDAFSVSVADGLAETGMKKRKELLISGAFGFFQFFMPLVGWILVKTIVSIFSVLEKFIPWIALILLCYLGGKMITEALKGTAEDENPAAAAAVTPKNLLVQAVATSIDALSVGFTMESYDIIMALGGSLIIGGVTMIMCIIALKIGKKIGSRFSGKATLVGGIILVLIGIEIFVKGVFF